MANERRTFHVGLEVVGIAIIVAAWILASAARDVKSANDTISVTGSARVSVESDYAVWQGYLQVFAASRQQAIRNIVTGREQLMASLQQAGVPDSLVSFENLSTYDQQEYDNNGRPTGRVLGVNASQQVVLRSSDVDLLEKVGASVEDLMMKGLPLQSGNLQYYYSKLEEARVSLMAEATTDAKKRAEQIAGAADGKVGSIRNARMGVIQVVAPQSTNVSDYGMYDTSTREKDIVAVVKVTFGVK